MKPGIRVSLFLFAAALALVGGMLAILIARHVPAKTVVSAAAERTTPPRIEPPASAYTMVTSSAAERKAERVVGDRIDVLAISMDGEYNLTVYSGYRTPGMPASGAKGLHWATLDIATAGDWRQQLEIASEWEAQSVASNASPFRRTIASTAAVTGDFEWNGEIATVYWTFRKLDLYRRAYSFAHTGAEIDPLLAMLGELQAIVEERGQIEIAAAIEGLRTR